MTFFDKKIVRALARENLHAFARLMFPVAFPNSIFEDAEYLPLLAAKVQEVHQSTGRRQIICLPPRSLKSYLATVAHVAWLLGHCPSLGLMIACHTLGLSTAHLRMIRTIMKSEEYASVFATRIGGKDSETEFETTAGGRVLAVSFEAAPTGRGCDGLIVDDPLKADQAGSFDALEACEGFFQNSLLSRLNDPSKAFVLVVMQRLAVGDLAGRLAGSSTYEQLVLPLQAVEDERIPYADVLGQREYARTSGALLNPKRMTPTDHDRMKDQLSDAAYAAQYQQQPLSAGGNLVKRTHLVYYDSPMVPRQIVQSWDTATSRAGDASYTVCLTWYYGEGHCDLIDVYREKVGTSEIGDTAVMLSKKYKPTLILVEEANAGFMVADYLKRERLSVETFRPSKSKEQRLEQCLSAFTDRRVRLPRNAPWLEVYVAELLAFPSSRHSDQVDATTQFLNYMLPRFLGDIRDRKFWMHPPCVARGEPHSGPRLAQVGRRLVPMGQPADLRPRRR